MNTPLVPASAVMAAVLLLIPHRLPAEEVAIVNPSTPVSAVPAELVRDYFLGQKAAWSDGTKVAVVLSRDASGQAPLLSFLGRSRNQFEVGWKKLIFTGRVTTPIQADSAEAVVELVAATPGAIGFVDRAKVTDRVRAISFQ